MPKILGLGIAGLGIAARQVLPHIGAISDRVRLTAVSDIEPGVLTQFAAENPGVSTFATVEALCNASNVDVVWVSTPNQYHAAHAVMAANAGKHVVCEKPMAITLAECDAIVEATQANGVKYVQGHSKIYYEPLRKMRAVIKGGTLGRVTQINSWHYNDWLIRPVTPSEVKTAAGAGPVFRQGPHQVDIVRYLAGSPVKSVRAVTGRHEAAYPETESEYTALLMFESGAAATLAFNAQGYFEAAELTWGIGESGYRMLNADSVMPRTRRAGAMTPEEKFQFVLNGDPYGRAPYGWEDERGTRGQPFFGITIVTCERGVIRQSPQGVYVYDKDGRREIPCKGGHFRGAAELLDLSLALEEGRDPFLDALWGRATLEVCVAILDSAKQDSEVKLRHQPKFRDVANW
jgi:phthalate 4,5-cis-dihydrodiol dehydrogenase